MKNNEPQTDVEVQALEFDKNIRAERLELAQNIKAQREKDRDFIKMYVTDITKLLDVPPLATQILIYMTNHVMEGNIVYMSTEVRDDLIKVLKKKRRQTISENLTKLVDADLIQLSRRNVYILNPHYFATDLLYEVRMLRKEYNYMKINIHYKYLKSREHKRIIEAVPVVKTDKKKTTTRKITKQEEPNTQIANDTNVNKPVTIEQYDDHKQAVDAFRQMCFDYDEDFFSMPQNIETFDNWCEMFKLDKQGNPRPYPTPKITCNNYFKKCIETYNNSIQDEAETYKNLANADLLGDFL